MMDGWMQMRRLLLPDSTLSSRSSHPPSINCIWLSLFSSVWIISVCRLNLHLLGSESILIAFLVEELFHITSLRLVIVFCGVLFFFFYAPRKHSSIFMRENCNIERFSAVPSFSLPLFLRFCLFSSLPALSPFFFSSAASFCDLTPSFFCTFFILSNSCVSPSAPLVHL